MSRGFARGAAALGIFALLYFLLVRLGLVLRENAEELTILWPAAGLLCLRLIAAVTTFHDIIRGFDSDPTLLRILLEGPTGLSLCAGL